MILHAYRLAAHATRDLSAPHKRSSQWPTVEKHWIATHPTCAACGGTERLNVHHKLPFHLNQEMELSPTNLITMCMMKDRHCHLLIGHGNAFRAYNPNVERDAREHLEAWNAKRFHVVEGILVRAKLNRLMT